MNASLVLVGKTNVGKSTLLNALIKNPLAIISPKPQTTIYAVRGLAEIGTRQLLCVDTPGIHQRMYQERGKQMNRMAYQAMREHDLVMCLFKAGSWDGDDERVQLAVSNLEQPKIAVITHTDAVTEAQLEDTLSHLNKELFSGIIGISVPKKRNLDMLAAAILCALPEHSSISPPQSHSDAFIAQEMIREQLMQSVHQEIPYAVQIEVTRTERTPEKLIIHANLIVTKLNHKKVIIGQNGSKIKHMGMHARRRISQLLGIGIELRLWVQCKDRPRASDHAE